MNNDHQPDLFGPAPTAGAYGLPPPHMLSAAADPATSSAAAQEHVQRGRRGANASRVLALVRSQPGSTSVELYTSQMVEAGRLDRHEISRRLADLATAGLVRQGTARTCRIAGRAMMTWWAVDVTNFPP